MLISWFQSEQELTLAFYHCHIQAQSNQEWAYTTSRSYITCSSQYSFKANIDVFNPTTHTSWSPPFSRTNAALPYSRRALRTIHRRHPHRRYSSLRCSTRQMGTKIGGAEPMAYSRKGTRTVYAGSFPPSVSFTLLLHLHQLAHCSVIVMQLGSFTKRNSLARINVSFRPTDIRNHCWLWRSWVSRREYDLQGLYEGVYLAWAANCCACGDKCIPKVNRSTNSVCSAVVMV